MARASQFCTDVTRKRWWLDVGPANVREARGPTPQPIRQESREAAARAATERLRMAMMTGALRSMKGDVR